MKKIIISLMLVAVLAGSCFALSACGNKADYNIGIVQLVAHPALDAAAKGFQDELKRLLEADGKTVKFNLKEAAGESSNCTTIANTFLAQQVDLMLAIATPAAQAAAATTDSTPILFTAVTDPVEAELVNSIAAPGGNISGTSDLNPVLQQATLIKELVPGITKVGVLYNTAEKNSLVQLELFKEACKTLNIEVVDAGLSGDINQLKGTMSALNGKVQAIYIPTDNMIAKAVELVHTENKDLNMNLPIVCGENAMNEVCGVATYGIDYYKLGVQTAQMAYKILTGSANISALAVEYQSGEPELTINEAVAAEIGFTIPQSVKDKIAVEHT